MKVRIFGWEEGLEKVSFAFLLRETGKTLKESKAIVDKVLDYEEIEIIVNEIEIPDFLLRAKQIGVYAKEIID